MSEDGDVKEIADDVVVNGVHAAHARRSTAPKRVLIVIAVILAVLLAAGIAVAVYFNSMVNQGRSQFAQTEWPEDIKTVEYNGTTYRYNPDVISICVIGNDKTRHDPGADYNGQADAIDVMAINTKTGQTTCITIPRNTMVEHWITGVGTENIVGTMVDQLCLVYSEGTSDEFSSKNVCNSVSIILDGVPMDYYFTIQETTIAEIANVIGGVTLVPMDSIPDTNITEGVETTLKGNDAMQYILWRDVFVPESANERHMRQQQFIKALASQTIQAAKANPSIIMDLYNVASANATTNLDASQFSYLASIIMDHGITSFDTVALTGDVIRNDYSGWEELTLDEESTRQVVLNVFYTPEN